MASSLASQKRQARLKMRSSVLLSRVSRFASNQALVAAHPVSQRFLRSVSAAGLVLHPSRLSSKRPASSALSRSQTPRLLCAATSTMDAAAGASIDSNPLLTVSLWSLWRHRLHFAGPPFVDHHPLCCGYFAFIVYLWSIPHPLRTIVHG